MYELISLYYKQVNYVLTAYICNPNHASFFNRQSSIFSWFSDESKEYETLSK